MSETTAVEIRGSDTNEDATKYKTSEPLSDNDVEKKDNESDRSEISPTDSDDLDLVKFPSKSINEEYIEYRETSKTLMYLIDNRDREKVSKWINKLDTMDEKGCMNERLLYFKYLTATLSGPYGLVEPFTSIPPNSVRPLHMVLPPIVLADLMDDQPILHQSRRKGIGRKPTSKAISIQRDYKFFEQQLFPPEGLICYAAAFSSAP
ncbi:Domain of unknown function DUF4485 [Cinara cedri]|uniref:DUF4485 domain-containing protein n=1 Tax=Cinara cedri TaxID=506608 RepID=A0A5E4MHB4_9HEMI|nr:Domain of unknown function DUF4485 [Cinara cedri]